HKINKRKMLAVLLGIGVALIGFFAAGHSH
ncbi:MAG: zinc/iron permease, partial [Pedobacter sp.]